MSSRSNLGPVKLASYGPVTKKSQHGVVAPRFNDAEGALTLAWLRSMGGVIKARSRRRTKQFSLREVGEMKNCLITGMPLFKRDKVKDLCDLDDRLLIAASDRISYCDVVLPTKLPGKGTILTVLSADWFREMIDIVGNHLLTHRQRRTNVPEQKEGGLRIDFPNIHTSPLSF